MNFKFDTIIIGGGLSGLLCGTYLSNQGQKVCILEKNPKIGGAVQPFKRGNEQFETGMHFISSIKSNQIQNDLFKIFGIDKKLNLYEKKDTAFKANINNKEYILPIGFNSYKKALIQYFPDEEKGISLYVSKIKEILESLNLNSILSGNINHESKEIGAYSYIESLTYNKDLQDLLTFNNILYGADRNTCSLYLHAIITGSYIQSIAEFKGGTESFLTILKNEIISNSGQIITNKKVVRIIEKNGKISKCICSDGSEFLADDYISSIHPALLLKLTDSGFLKSFYRNRINSLNNSKGAFLIYIILKNKSFNFLDSAEFYFRDSIEENKRVSDLNFMIHTPYYAKSGEFANILKVMSLVDFEEVKEWYQNSSLNRNDDYEDYKNRKADLIINFINENYPGFKKNILKIYTSSPLTYIKYTGTIDGSAYGIIHDYKNPSVSNIPVRTKIKNLFLTGQNINFHGMLGVSITSLLTCYSILKKI